MNLVGKLLRWIMGEGKFHTAAGSWSGWGKDEGLEVRYEENRATLYYWSFNGCPKRRMSIFSVVASDLGSGGGYHGFERWIRASGHFTCDEHRPSWGGVALFRPYIHRLDHC